MFPLYKQTALHCSIKCLLLGQPTYNSNHPKLNLYLSQQRNIRSYRWIHPIFYMKLKISSNISAFAIYFSEMNLFAVIDPPCMLLTIRSVNNTMRNKAPENTRYPEDLRFHWREKKNLYSIIHKKARFLFMHEAI